MIFLRIGWMDRYRGLASGDRIQGGGAFVALHGFGHEIFNFLPHNERVYGYVQPPGAAHNDESDRTININRLGAKSGDDSISGVTAVWAATRPGGGTVVVGWYRNATVFRNWQKPPAGAPRSHAGIDFGYCVTASADDATLLPSDERLMLLPHGRGGMGQSNVWYADDTEAHQGIRRDVEAYLATRLPPPSRPRALTKQPDPFLRQQIERAAIEKTVAYYTRLGYSVGSVERDNTGWDLNAAHPNLANVLKIEVKGLSGDDTCVDVTPNEFARMKEYRDAYRLCIIAKALHDPQIAVFAYSAESGGWQDQKGRSLQIEEIVAARCRAQRAE